MKKMIVMLLLLIQIIAFANNDILLYKVENKDLKVSAQSLADGLTAYGYIVAKNQDMNGPYKKQFGTSTFQSYTLMSVYHPETSVGLVPKYAESGIFTPFSIAVYQRQGEDDLYIALLTAKAQENIIKKQDVLFSSLEVLNKETIAKILPDAIETSLGYANVKTDKPLYTKYSFDVDDDDAVEAMGDLMMMMQSGMKPSGFVVANYIDFNAILKEEKNEDYIFYDAYSLCKLKIIYELSKTKPEAGAFAPCTMVIYHRKGSNKTEIVSLNIDNLTSTLAIDDKGLLTMLEKAQSDMKNIIEESAE
ncbi:MAG: DUF302 domain-containing protein [Sulfurovum sp.]|uniref:DUF302 domain-containing protein n=1 Tax=Sulfurovum sp. TaxID=1969726 RepID=UPI0028680DEE|nr:DUF302 domain-containing protein [Sulfurovum sp.]MCO4845157.1 DUF302 domain-containing protein [Sulfurovum sp.]